MATAGDILLLIAQSLWLMLPAYLSNMAPVFVGGGRPIDNGKTWSDGRRILGDGKTWRGIILGPVVGSVVFLLASLYLLPTIFASLDLRPYGTWSWTLFFAYAMGLGALVGDATESFFKRRRGIDRGRPWPVFDQLDFLAGAWAFGLLASLIAQAAGYPGSWFLTTFSTANLVVLLILTPGLHLLVNFIGWKIGKKNVPW
ncbi:MAG: CDP-2,3-bis-(O-geranylgeranyl)-sn-glycerol synthase [Thermoplasmatota archaeon]